MPVPVSSVNAARRLALEGVARNVAIPEPGVSAENTLPLFNWMSPLLPAGAPAVGVPQALAPVLGAYPVTKSPLVQFPDSIGLTLTPIDIAGIVVASNKII